MLLTLAVYVKKGGEGGGCHPFVPIYQFALPMILLQTVILIFVFSIMDLGSQWYLWIKIYASVRSMLYFYISTFFFFLDKL